MPDSWLPENGSITGFDDGEIVVAREGQGHAFAVSVSDHVVAVTELDGVPDDAIVLPESGEGVVRYADGRGVPPFDEIDLLANGPWVRGGDMAALLVLDSSPFGDGRVLRYEFVDAQLRELRLIRFDAGDAGEFVELDGDLRFTWRSRWSDWCDWRAGITSGEEWLAKCKLRGTWGYITLSQGLFEADHFVAARPSLAAPAPELMLLRLLDW